ncbi:MAG: hypothetical protein ACOCXH_14275 [Cyclobacteriaceae bacterium]
MNKFFIMVLVWAGLLTNVFAQQENQGNWEESGQIEDARVIIEKDRKLELPQAVRNYEKVPPLPVPEENQTITYNFQNFHLNPGVVEPRIRVFTIKEDPLDKLYGNFVKAGIGNYLTPYLELYSYNKRSDEYSFGTHFRHLSSIHGPVDKRNSGVSDNMLAFSGKYFTEPLTFTGKAQYRRNKVYFYGYNPEVEVLRDTIKQVFNQFELNAGVEDNFEDALASFRLNTRFNYLKDRFDARELIFNLDGDLDFEISDQLEAVIETDLLLTSRKDVNTLNRNLFKLRPTFRYQTEQLHIEAGFNVVFNNDTLANNTQLNFYPVANASYKLVEEAVAYAGIDGDINAVTFESLFNENPWIDRQIPLLHTNKTFEIYGGLKGNLVGNLAYDAGFSLGTYKNMHFFANSASDTTRFSVIYDNETTTVFNFFGEVNFLYQENLKLGFRGDLFSYNTGQVAEAWHLPTVKIAANGFYNLYDKIIFSSELYFLAGLQGYMLRSDRSNELEDIVDFNLKIDYLFSPRFSVFLSFENMFGNNYQRYLNYPSRGLLVMGGLTYTF